MKQERKALIGKSVVVGQAYSEQKPKKTSPFPEVKLVLGFLTTVGVIGACGASVVKAAEKDKNIRDHIAAGGDEVDINACPEWTSVMASDETSGLSYYPTFNPEILVEDVSDEIMDRIERVTEEFQPKEYWLEVKIPPTVDPAKQGEAIIDCATRSAGISPSQKDIEQQATSAEITNPQDPSEKGRIVFEASDSLSKELNKREDNLAKRLSLRAKIAGAFSLLRLALYWKRKNKIIPEIASAGIATASSVLSNDAGIAALIAEFTALGAAAVQRKFTSPVVKPSPYPLSDPRNVDYVAGWPYGRKSLLSWTAARKIWFVIKKGWGILRHPTLQEQQDAYKEHYQRYGCPPEDQKKYPTLEDTKPYDPDPVAWADSR